jgi:ActR/RegA family two-component response regulator
MAVQAMRAGAENVLGFSDVDTCVRETRRGGNFDLATVLRRMQTHVPLHATTQLDVARREHIARTLLAFQGNVTRAASALGVHRQTLQRWRRDWC